MRKITKEITYAFSNKIPKTIGNSSTDGKTLFLHGNAIARHNKAGDLEISNGGWSSNTTKERLNGLIGVYVNQKNLQWYLNGKKWNGNWVVVKDFIDPLRDSKFYKTLTSYLATAYAEGFCEGEGASETEQLTAWQYLVDKDIVWNLQGWFGRTAQNLINNNYIKAKA